jgi:DNA repair protein RadC
MPAINIRSDVPKAHDLAARDSASRRAPAASNSILAHLRERFATNGWEIEHLHAIFFDAARLYIGDRRMGSGQLDKLSTRLRPLFNMALDLGANGLILAHNHPSGDCRPSPGDISATRHLASVASALDIELFDHLIITPHSAYSMRKGALV